MNAPNTSDTSPLEKGWKKRKITNATVTKLTETMTFDDWLAELRVALLSEDVHEIIFPGTNPRFIHPSVQEEYTNTCRDVLLNRLDATHLRLVSHLTNPLEIFETIKNF